nr:TolC family protein [uncultured Limnohabitans sp.]
MNMKRWVFYGLAFCLPTALAETTSVTEQLPRLAKLDQQGFLQLLVARSVEVEFSQLNTEVTQRLMQAEAGLYEVSLTMGLRGEGRRRQRTATERTQNFSTAATEVLDENANTDEFGIRSKLPWGSEVSLSYKPTRKTNNLIPQINSGQYDTEYNTSLSLTVKQPLLRNAGRNVTETDLAVAELERKIALQQFSQQLFKSSIDGLGLYWQLYRAEATLTLRQSAYTSTLALVEDSKWRIEAGKLPASAVLEIHGALLNRQAEVTRSQQALREAQARVATALNMVLDPNYPLSTHPKWVEQNDSMLHRPLVFEQALQLWPPYQIAQLKLAQAQIRLNFARNQMRPVMDLIMGYSGTGYDYKGQAARTTALQNKFPDWYLGVNVEIPLQGNQKATQQYFAQNARLSQAQLEVTAIETSFSNDLSVRHNDMLSARKVLNASRDEVAIRQTLYDNELKRHQIGVGLLSTLIQKQIDFTEAQQRQLENQIRFEVALATWQYTQSSLFNEHQIQLTSRDVSQDTARETATQTTRTTDP